MTGDRAAAPVTAFESVSARAATFWLAIVLLVSLVARLWYSSISPLSYDETHNLMIGMLANQGYTPYREIYSVIMPFSIFIVQASAALWGATQHVRTLMMLFGLMGVAALFWLVLGQARSAPVLAALAAATFFSFNPHFFFVSTSINLEGGALAWGLLSVALVEHSGGRRINRSCFWVLLSGVAFGLSTTTKVFVPFIPAIIAFQLLLSRVEDSRRSLRRFGTYWPLLRLGLIWTAGVVAVVILFLILSDSSALMTQVLASRFALREAIETDAEGVNIAEALEAPDLLQYLPLIVGSLFGLAAVWRQRLVPAWIWPAWLVLAAAFLLAHDPVRPRHTVMALPPIAALSGIGLASMLGYVKSRDSQLARWLNPVLTATVLVPVVLAPLPLVNTEAFTDRHPVRQDAIDFVQENTAPTDCLISKENRLHFLAGRLSTPYLSLISTARLYSGLLPASAIAAEANAHDCPVLVYADTFDRIIPDLRRELENVYAVRLTLADPEEPDYPLDIYAFQMNDTREPENQRDLLLGERIAFRGYDITAGPWQPGQDINLTTFWRVQEPVEADYKFFVHLLDGDGNTVANYDHYPFALDPNLPVKDIELSLRLLADSQEPAPPYPAMGMIPTRLWPQVGAIAETIELPLPADLAPGTYMLGLGMYDEQTMQRLPVTGLEVESDQILTDAVTVD